MIKQIKLEIIIICIIIISCYFIYPIYSILTLFWFIIYFYLKLKGKYDILNRKEKRSWIFTAYFYPLIEALLKIFIIKSIIPYSWNFINRTEHLIFSIVITLLLYPLMKLTIKKLNSIESFIFIVGLVISIGIFNEFFEYVLRLHYHLTDSFHFSIYYWDTIYDMFMNLLGAIIGFFIIKKLK